MSLENSSRGSLTRWQYIAVAALLAVLASPVQAGAGFMDAGQLLLDARLRYEHVDQAVAGRDTGEAATLRTRLGYRSATVAGFTGLAEFEGVWALNDEDAYNSLRNGAVDKGVIADPTGEELNRAWLRYSGLPDTELTVGRQRIIFDNARFIGNVGWRQNEQTFRAAMLTNQSLRHTRLSYVYISNVETILSTNRPMDSQLINFHFDPWGERLALTLYGYLLDFDLAAELDSQTWGLRASGSRGRLRYAVELARQSGWRDSDGAAVEPDADFVLLEIGTQAGPLSLLAGWQSLGANRDAGKAPFNTPLATLHKFQGWADVFLATPDDGLEDLYLQVGATVAEVRLLAVYHRFGPDGSGADYGDEIDLQAKRALGRRWSGLLKYARYDADASGMDTDRLWLQLEYRY